MIENKNTKRLGIESMRLIPTAFFIGRNRGNSRYAITSSKT